MQKDLDSQISERERERGGERKEGKKKQTQKNPSETAHTVASIKAEQMDNPSKTSSQLPLSPSNPLLPLFAFQCLIYALPVKHSGKTFPPPSQGINIEQITAAP